MIPQKRRTCVVLQPGYLPWLGFFEQVDRADVFVYLDDVQFDKHGWRNRNRIKGPSGPQWLTVPVRTHGLNQPAIREVRIDPTQPRWAQKHLNALRAAYEPSPYFDGLFDELQPLLLRTWENLIDLDIESTSLLCRQLGLSIPAVRSSALALPMDRSARLVHLCQVTGCRHYYSGAAAREYLDCASFEHAGIEVTFQSYNHPTYPQRFGPFIPHLSVVDLMFQCGPDSLSIIRRGAKKPEDAPLVAPVSTRAGAEQSLAASIRVADPII